MAKLDKASFSRDRTNCVRSGRYPPEVLSSSWLAPLQRARHDSRKEAHHFLLTGGPAVLLITGMGPRKATFLEADNHVAAFRFPNQPSAATWIAASLLSQREELNRPGFTGGSGVPRL